MDQRRLVERAQRGDHDAFAQLVRSGLPRLDGAAFLIVRDRELARDAVQEAWVHAWRDLRGLRNVEKFDAWIYRLTVNACLDELRRRRRRVIEVAMSPAVELHGAHPEEDVTDRALVDAALRRLDPRTRAVVVLHYFLGLPLTDVAIVLRIPVGTVKSRLHRALGEMRAEASSEPQLARLAPERKPA